LAGYLVEHIFDGTPSGNLATEQMMTSQHDASRNPERPPEEWVTGDEPMTGPQESYLHTLAREAGEEVPDELTKAKASEEIERLQQETGRGA
jgi:hypothetical protein